jgi:hypothetical protein
MSQEREVKGILQSLNKTPAELEKRLAYLEKAEYSKLNYYAAIYLAVGQILDTTAGLTIIPSMTSTYLKGFTLASSALTCTEAGVYVLNYSISVSTAVSTTLASLVYKTGVFAPGSYMQLNAAASAISVLSAPLIVSLEVGDTISLMMDSTPNNIVVGQASLVLNRVGDN